MTVEVGGLEVGIEVAVLLIVVEAVLAEVIVGVRQVV